MAKKTGRPSKLTQELTDRICELLATGHSMARICEMDDMPSFNTIWRWEKENAEFREASAHARRIGTHYMADDCLRIADMKPEVNPSTGAGDSAFVAWQKLRIDTRIRLIGKWNAKEFGDKLDLTTQGEKITPPPINLAH